MIEAELVRQAALLQRIVVDGVLNGTAERPRRGKLEKYAEFDDSPPCRNLRLPDIHPAAFCRRLSSKYRRTASLYCPFSTASSSVS